jgi:hypothetical protein
LARQFKASSPAVRTHQASITRNSYRP